jgi:hypothetical protein
MNPDILCKYIGKSAGLKDSGIFKLKSMIIGMFKDPDRERTDARDISSGVGVSRFIPAFTGLLLHGRIPD